MQLKRGFQIWTVTSLALIALSALADGTVTQIAGTITAKRSGDILALTRGSTVKEGDVITTEKGAYAQIKFSDGMIMTLKPSTQVAIKDQHFSETEPEQDKFTLGLLKGGLRTISGLIGKRGNRDAYKMNTATATIGIRGTVFDVDDCSTTKCTKGTQAKIDDTGTVDTKAKTEASDEIAPAVYVGVHDGEVVVKNDAGELTLSAGQFGIAPANNVVPLQLPGDPGLSQISSLGSSVEGDTYSIQNCR
ncbi:MAG: FecR family protein [Methylophilales bacterium]|nr:FecR family protein [Methylophilales bacterium]